MNTFDCSMIINSYDLNSQLTPYNHLEDITIDGVSVLEMVRVIQSAPEYILNIKIKIMQLEGRKEWIGRRNVITASEDLIHSLSCMDIASPSSPLYHNVIDGIDCIDSTSIKDILSMNNDICRFKHDANELIYSIVSL